MDTSQSVKCTHSSTSLSSSRGLETGDGNTVSSSLGAPGVQFSCDNLVVAVGTAVGLIVVVLMVAVVAAVVLLLFPLAAAAAAAITAAATSELILQL